MQETLYENDVYDNPESYLDESQRTLSREQEEKIEILKEKISNNTRIIEELQEYLEGEEDEEKIENVENKIEDLEETINELEEEIEEIEENPDGDFPQDLIDDAVDGRLDDVRYDPLSFIREWDLRLEDFINKEDFIEGVIDSDGYGNCISSYDGNADEVNVEGTTYWVIRIN
jgi:thymidylate synthase